MNGNITIHTYTLYYLKPPTTKSTTIDMSSE